MDSELKCNRLTCRRSLIDKAVVTTCSHIFCVECATELFNASRLCPACETSLLEPDDVVICSLHPSNDYKTSVLSGLTPMNILEICSRAISFWQYQIQQESAFQQAVLRNVGDKNAQLQKQLENVVREATGEIGLLNSKIAELERDLEIERRKNRELQDAARDRDKEYQKLKVAHDKFKRKALFHSGPTASDNPNVPINNHGNIEQVTINRLNRPHAHKPIDLGNVLGGMEANRIQRTPLLSRTAHPGGVPQNNSWAPQGQRNAFRASFPAPTGRSQRPGYTSDCSDSLNEVENLLTQHPPRPPPLNVTAETGNWPMTKQRQRTHNVFAPPANNRGGGFRPAPR